VEIAGDFELLAVSEDHFHLGVSNFEITFCRNDSGKVDRLVMVQNGERFDAKKVPQLSS
jgi:hypothetical protein